MNAPVKTPEAKQTVAVAQPAQAARLPAATAGPTMKDLVEMPIERAIDALGPQFANALPAHIPMERFRRVVMTAISSNPELARADRRSLFNSAIKSAQDGLLPDGREAALVIFNTKMKVNGQEKWVDAVQYMPMVAGIRKKVRNSSEIATWDVKAVYQKDEFIYEEGLNQTLQHIPYLSGDPGQLVAVYSIARLKTGEVSIDVMPKWQVDKIKALSKVGDKGPWGKHYDEMAKKTVARRHSKVLPMSTDLDDLIRRDDDLYDFDGASDRGAVQQDSLPQRPRLTDFTDVPQQPEAPQQPVDTIDPETGEVTPTQAEAEGPAADDEEEGPIDGGEIGAYEAREMGRKARDAGKPLASVPPEIEQLNYADAFQDGWRSRDEEIAENAKALRRAKEGE